MRIRSAIFPTVAGALINVAVAWACAVESPNNPFGWNRGFTLHTPPVPHIEDGFYQRPGCHVDWQCGKSFGYFYVETARYHGSDLEWCNFASPQYYPTVREMGWPMRSMRSVTHCISQDHEPFEPRGTALPWREIVSRGMQTADLPAWVHPSLNGRLAFVPMPVGFAVNTIIFAAVAFGIRRLGERVLKRRRVQRGFEVQLLPE